MIKFFKEKGKYLLLSIFLLPPFFVKDNYIVTIFILANIMVLFTVSWDITGGLCGMMNLGQALFFGTATYFAAASNLFFKIDPFVNFFIAPLAAATVAVLSGFGIVRLKGAFLALFTLVLGELFYEGSLVQFMLPEKGYIIGGEGGLPQKQLFSSEAEIYYYLFSILFVVLIIMGVYRLSRSSFGIILRGIQKGEREVKASGINVEKFKIIALGISGLVAGIAGSLYVHFIGRATPYDFSLELSFSAVTFSILGGRGTVLGPAVVAYIMTIFFSFFEIQPSIRLIFYCLVVIITITFIPKGIVKR